MQIVDGSLMMLTQTDLAIGDYYQLGIGASNGPHVPAKVTFTITWSPGPNPKHLHVHDTSNGFGGDFIQGVSSASWRPARVSRSDPLPVRRRRP